MPISRLGRKLGDGSGDGASTIWVKLLYAGLFTAVLLLLLILGRELALKSPGAG
jgi:hypothetical protein